MWMLSVVVFQYQIFCWVSISLIDAGWRGATILNPPQGQQSAKSSQHLHHHHHHVACDKIGRPWFAMSHDHRSLGSDRCSCFYWPSIQDIKYLLVFLVFCFHQVWFLSVSLLPASSVVLSGHRSLCIFLRKPHLYYFMFIMLSACLLTVNDSPPPASLQHYRSG